MAIGNAGGVSRWTDRTVEFALHQGDTVRQRLRSVGNQRLKASAQRVEKATSDVLDIAGPQHSLIPQGEVYMIPANPNKILSLCAVRHVAAEVVRRFNLSLDHVWELCYCSTQHTICQFQFAVKCSSLVHQWNENWAQTQWGQDWLAACEKWEEGRLSSLFMNMTPSRHNNRVTNLLKRVTSSHTDNRTRYTPEFCSQQIWLLRQFAHDLENLGDGSSSVEFLKRACNRNGTLYHLKNVGVFTAAQLAAILFFWNLVNIPCWRASECPILDPSKEHYQRGIRTETDDGVAPQEYTALHDLATDRNRCNIKSLEAVHRALCIVCHQRDTSELYVENGCCEGVRPKDVLDLMVVGMLSLDLRPAPWSNPYQPVYQLWKKPWGETEEWTLVPPERVGDALSLLTPD